MLNITPYLYANYFFTGIKIRHIHRLYMINKYLF